MKKLLRQAGRQALFALEPETAHRLSIQALQSGLLPSWSSSHDKRLAVHVAGLDFDNPVGVAAGFDKNAEVPDAVLRLGFGFTEIGSVTPLPQEGNPKRRIFRLREDRAVINRLGFNNEGHQAVLSRLRSRTRQPGQPVGVNIGANKDAEDRIADYVRGVECFYDVADYFTVNISSPNTPGLRDLQARSSLAALMEAVCTARAHQIDKGKDSRPIFLKISPDLSEGEMDDICDEVKLHPLDGLAISNTTLSRTGLKSRHAPETGGLSGEPLFERSTALLAKVRQRVGPSMALIGIGGIDGATKAMEKIRAGADLVQLYTGFIYEGPDLARKMLLDFSDLVTLAGVSSISDLRDTKVDQWAAKPHLD
ncbi:MAG: quinone-dependent dihydroorotate dehydrogenase [Alphaproteobacteria bacterium]|nr:quinone-dependent dihydroorotate dehydrogenase [Alphaproteobacteria bacterium]